MKTHVGHLLGVGYSFKFYIHRLPKCTVFSKASVKPVLFSSVLD